MKPTVKPRIRLGKDGWWTCRLETSFAITQGIGRSPCLAYNAMCSLIPKRIRDINGLRPMCDPAPKPDSPKTP